MIETIRSNLRAYTTDVVADPSREQAAVLIPLTNCSEPELILTLRSASLSSHAGEVAWPGGRYDESDGSLVNTAIRESEEEIGLSRDAVDVIGELRPFISKYGLSVTPFVGLIPDDIELKANRAELEELFRVPLRFLLDDPRRDTDIISRHGEIHHTPVYYYNDNKIWGLTAMILLEFLKHGLKLAV